jgi:hypothetical protein
VNASASAVAPGADEVLLKNGGVLRGTVVRLDPGNEISILVSGSDRPRVIAWRDVAEVERGSVAPGAGASLLARRVLSALGPFGGTGGVGEAAALPLMIRISSGSAVDCPDGVR